MRCKNSKSCVKDMRMWNSKEWKEWMYYVLLKILKYHNQYRIKLICNSKANNEKILKYHIISVNNHTFTFHNWLMLYRWWNFCTFLLCHNGCFLTLYRSWYNLLCLLFNFLHGVVGFLFLYFFSSSFWYIC